MKSFRDPVTGVLRAWGYAESNGSDLVREEKDSFNLEPGKWRLVGDVWQAYAPVAVPRSVTRRQARRALFDVGLLDAVPAAIDQIEDLAVRQRAKIDWEDSQEVQRDWPLVGVLAPVLGLTDAQLDNLFILASTL